MGYFDGLTDAIFKQDATGNTIFYPWGVLGKGYILDSDETRQRIRNTVKNSYKGMFLAAILIAAINAVYRIDIFLWVAAALYIPYVVWYIITIKRITSGLVLADEKLTFTESYTNSAKSHNLATLFLGCMMCLLFVAGGIWSLSAGDILIGSIVTAFFGPIAVLFVYMIKVKLSQK